MRNISIWALFLLTLFVCCEENESSDHSDDRTINNYDQEYFRGFINNDSVSLDNESNYFSASRMDWISNYSNSDSVVVNYGFNCGNTSFSLRLDFFFKEAVENIDTLNIAHRFKNNSLLTNIFNESSWIYIQDSLALGRGGYIMNDSKEINHAIYIRFSDNSNIWHSGLINKSIDASDFSFNISSAYIKPVKVNYSEVNSGKDTDSLLYIEGEFNCILFNDRDNSTKVIKDAIFRANIDIDYFND
ncbi:MAG: hypothetical protein JXB00_02490 [Bacteroidales bacterium]|nr:hypothetical protein [Bacteroidales bacterium]